MSKDDNSEEFFPNGFDWLKTQDIVMAFAKVNRGLKILSDRIQNQEDQFYRMLTGFGFVIVICIGLGVYNYLALKAKINEQNTALVSLTETVEFLEGGLLDSAQSEQAGFEEVVDQVSEDNETSILTESVNISGEHTTEVDDAEIETIDPWENLRVCNPIRVEVQIFETNSYHELRTFLEENNHRGYSGSEFATYNIRNGEFRYTVTQGYAVEPGFGFGNYYYPQVKSNLRDIFVDTLDEIPIVDGEYIEVFNQNGRLSYGFFSQQSFFDLETTYRCFPDNVMGEFDLGSYQGGSELSKFIRMGTFRGHPYGSVLQVKVASIVTEPLINHLRLGNSNYEVGYHKHRMLYLRGSTYNIGDYFVTYNWETDRVEIRWASSATRGMDSQHLEAKKVIADDIRVNEMINIRIARMGGSDILEFSDHFFVFFLEDDPTGESGPQLHYISIDPGDMDFDYYPSEFTVPWEMAVEARIPFSAPDGSYFAR